MGLEVTWELAWEDGEERGERLSGKWGNEVLQKGMGKKGDSGVTREKEDEEC